MDFGVVEGTKFWYLLNMVGKNTSIALSERQTEYCRRKVASGEFGTISEVIRDALRLSEERDLRIERLRGLIREGEESGPAQPFDFDSFIAAQFPRA
jgi:antitoxin ParD1/3/4